MGLIEPEVLQRLYGKWQELLNREEGKVLKKIIALDGKTMRGNRRGGEKACQIVTIDAMGTQIKIAEKIRSRRADYVLALKGNQGTLYEEVKEYFGDKEFQKEMEHAGNYKKTVEKARGQRNTGISLAVWGMI